ncbi:hypothetical protein AUR64_06035 [Haloprofundus marisrubri]|uniref:DUF7981 domain-containing protein n=1 Tax=Haloprofundus marisrubri TaxID=1514971 RepID=A0A0W1RBH9_9EURY|nr:hypothetical protein [Haloprofundus marisrubri]KTG10747.1 hypothetical protein AUR64_06035 [Haloprofundus marisrubri]
MNRRVKSSLLWGAVGVFAFLALAQGYVLVAGPLPVGFLGRIGIALVVGAVAAGVSYATELRLLAR